MSLHKVCTGQNCGKKHCQDGPLCVDCKHFALRFSRKRVLYQTGKSAEPLELNENPRNDQNNQQRPLPPF